ncbi:MAG: PrsW family intramembrane metalloprotease [Candidatus Omnitrophica bacterium]|nr:PrsW family intramembrane metalloprotease [Candidatus Omnitrophota bacterium]
MNLLLLALSPAIALAVYFYHKDKYEKEPLQLLIKAFLWGFFGSISVLIAEMIMSFLIRPVESHLLKIFLESFFVAGLIEELFKFLVFYFLIFFNDEFDEPYDGIVYAVMVSLGLAAFENIGYVLGAYLNLGILAATATGVMRAMLSVPAHAFFGAIMGYYLGLAKFASDEDARSTHIITGVGLAVVLHGLFDFFIFSHTGLGILFMLCLLVFCWRLSLRAIELHVDGSPFGRKEESPPGPLP